MKRYLILTAALAALLSGAAAFAVNPDKYPITPDLDKQNAEMFDAQAAHIRQEMDKGGRYEFIKERDRASVEDGLNFMHDLIAAKGTVAAMREEDKIRLFNRQERVNALLTNSDRERVICEKAYQPGSLFRTTTCHTVAEQAKRERDAQNGIEASQNHAMMGSGFGAAKAGH
jgi:hypothetical protein